MNPLCFNTHRSFPLSFNLSNAGEFFWSYLLEDCTCIARFKKRIRKSFQVLCLCPPQKVKLVSFLSWLCHDDKEMYKNAECTCITNVFLIQTSYHFFVILIADVLLRACLHGVGDPGLVGLVSFVFMLWGTQNKRNLPH